LFLIDCSIKTIFDRYQQAIGTSLWVEQYEVIDCLLLSFRSFSFLHQAPWLLLYSSPVHEMTRSEKKKLWCFAWFDYCRICSAR